MGAPGVDDAPVVTVPLGKEPNKRVTMIYPYYDNPKFLARQIGFWSTWNVNGVAHLVSTIVVDDGSPQSPAVAVVRATPPPEFRIRVFRIDVDIRWNWLAARNIAAHCAPEGWLLLTDMDHVVPESVMLGLIYGRHNPSVIYRFSRVGAKTHPHPNSWFMTRAMFWKIGGYDEALSGHYGTDGDYRRRCAATAPVRILTDALVCHEHQGDASTTTYKRKQPEDARAKKLMRQRGPDWRPKVLSFPYHEVAL